MRAVIQRVNRAEVRIVRSIEVVVPASIGVGLVVLLGVGRDDVEEDATWLAGKIAALRIFADAEGKMNRSIVDVGGEALVVSQFTLHAKYKKGTRPSFIHAAAPELAIPLYESFVRQLESLVGKRVKTGRFGADMEVDLVNNGPVTITMDTKNKA